MFTWLQNPTREQVNQVRREEVEDNFRDILKDAASEPQHVMLQIASGIAMAQQVFAEKFPSFNDYAKQPKTVKAAFDAGLRDYAKRCGEVEPETAGGITIAGMFFTMIEMWGDNSIDRAQLDRSANLLNQFMDNAKRIIDQKTKTETVPDEIVGTFAHITDMRENFDSFVKGYHSA
jgi:hypothetical protein